MELSIKHQEFINAYFECSFNGTAAYQRVYPDSTYESAKARASELLTNHNIADTIQFRIDENAMRANEVLKLLAEQARGDMADFWDMGDTPALNLASPRAKARSHLIKRLKVKTTKRTIGEIDEVTTDIDLELYDAQQALALIGKHHKLFTEKTELTLRPADSVITLSWGDHLEYQITQPAQLTDSSEG